MAGRSQKTGKAFTSAESFMKRSRLNINWGCLVKVLALAAMIAVIMFVYLSCSGGGSCLCQRIDKTLPDIQKAPYSIATVTFWYYAKTAVQNSDGSANMTGWYDKQKGKWVYHSGSEYLPAILKPKVSRR